MLYCKIIKQYSKAPEVTAVKMYRMTATKYYIMSIRAGNGSTEGLHPKKHHYLLAINDFARKLLLRLLSAIKLVLQSSTTACLHGLHIM